MIRDALGEPLKRNGERSAWRCPFHDDHDPSFTVDPRGWRCWACGIGGDAAAFVMRHEKIGFPEAVRRLGERVGIHPSGGSRAGQWPARSRPAAPPKSAPRKKEPRSGSFALERAEAEELVAASAARLWTPEGREALEYLRARGLNDETIRRHRLGWTPRATLANPDGTRYWRVDGIVIPWFDGDRLAMVKIRREGDRRPKYVQAFSEGPSVYPVAVAVAPSRPLVVAEGEFDALLLGQELGDLATVITLGSSAARPDTAVVKLLTRSQRCYLATDADESGEGAAAKWATRAIRVAPPAGKDWTEAFQAGVDLRRWWRENALIEPSPAPAPPPAVVVPQPAPPVEVDDRPVFYPDPRLADILLKPIGSRYPNREERLARAARGDELRRLGLALPLWCPPEPREKAVPTTTPGERADGRP